TSRSPGIPCTASSFRLMQFTPGNLYTSCGADCAPCSRMTVAPTSSSSAVVMPDRTARFMASSMRRTIAPAARIPANSSGPVIDTILLANVALLLLSYYSHRTIWLQERKRLFDGMKPALGQASLRLPGLRFSEDLPALTPASRSSNFQPQFLGQAFSDFCWQAIVNVTRADLCDINHRRGRRRRYRHAQPDHS